MEHTILICLWYILFIFLGIVWGDHTLEEHSYKELCNRMDARAERQLQELYKKTNPQATTNKFK